MIHVTAQNRFRSFHLVVVLISITLASSACDQAIQSSRTSGARTVISPAHTFISVQGVPQAIAVDGLHVYWSSLGLLNDDGTWNTKVINGSIMRANKDGSNVTTLVSGLYPPWAIALDTSDVYWIGVDGIKRVSKEGGLAEALLSWSPPGPPYTPEIPVSLDIAVDATHVYWTDCGANSVLKIEKLAHTAIPLAAGRYCPVHLSMDQENVYWIDLQDDGSVMKVSKDGTGLGELVRHKGGLADLTVDDSSAYWIADVDFINHEDGEIASLRFDRNVFTRLATGQKYPEHLLVDANNLYWVEGSLQKALMKMPKQGGQPQTMTLVDSHTGDIAIDATTLYVTIPGSRRIVSIPKSSQ